MTAAALAIMVARRGNTFFIRCIYCSIIGSVARDKRSQPNLLIFAAPVLLILPFSVCGVRHGIE
ncbi:hypothetical protein KCP74_00835 [Salmonella enterica subsp. enterica]|nr:hypothetical protein KCP74_00835 [Salmonella enterica subsp. enterica]